MLTKTKKISFISLYIILLLIFTYLILLLSDLIFLSLTKKNIIYSNKIKFKTNKQTNLLKINIKNYLFLMRLYLIIGY